MEGIKFMHGGLGFLYNNENFEISKRRKILASGYVKDIYLFHYSYKESESSSRTGAQLNATISHDLLAQPILIYKNGFDKDITKAKLFCDLVMRIGHYDDKGLVKSAFAKTESQEKRIRESKMIKNNLKATVDDFYNELARLPGLDSWGTRKEIKYLRTIMREGEKVFAIASGIMGGNTWLIACTSYRIIFVDCGMIYGVKHSEVMIDKVNAVSFKNGLILGEIRVEDGASTRLITNVNKNSTKPFVDAVHKSIELFRERNQKMVNHSSVSAADEILKLKKLCDNGIISKHEFEKAKRKLLG